MLLQSLKWTASIAFAAALMMQGCGNDDASSASTTSSETASSSNQSSSSGGSSASTITGVVIDGYWRNAKVCVDVNGNNQCDDDEPYMMSGVGGAYSINVDAGYVNTKNLVAEGTAGETIDEGLNNGAGGTITTNTTFMTPANKQHIITPITTLMKAKIDEGKSEEEAESEVATLLSIPQANLFNDYIADEDAETESKAENVTAVLQSDDNNASQAILDLAFTIADTNPEADSEDVAIDTAIKATFSGTIDTTTLGGKAVLTHTSNDSEVEGSVDASDKVVTFTPESTLSYATQYTMTIKEGLKDTLGNTLKKDFSWSFTTGTGQDATPPTLYSSTPADGATDVATSTNITLEFSEAIKESSVTSSSVTLVKSPSTEVATSISFEDASTIIINPDSDLSKETEYTLTLGTGITDELGNALASAQTINFTTAGDFYLASNDITIKCEDAAVWETGTVGGVTYTKIDAKTSLTTEGGSVNPSQACTSGVTSMGNWFYIKTDFNEDISTWDTSSVTEMYNMFAWTQAFNQDISHWDTSSVTNMNSMFLSGKAFEQDISSWDVANATYCVNFALLAPINSTAKMPSFTQCSP